MPDTRITTPARGGGNFFDQFDAPPQAAQLASPAANGKPSTNFFDQFDHPLGQGRASLEGVLFGGDSAPPKITMNQLERALSPITNYPATYQQMNNESVDQMAQGIDQITGTQQRFDPVKDAAPPDSNALRIAKGVGNVALGGIGYMASPINAFVHSIVGKPVEDVTGIPSQYTDFAASLAIPGIGMTRVPKIVAPPTGPLGVVLSEGQRTRDLPAIQREQAALRNTTGGDAAHAHAQDFAAQQAGQVANATDQVRRGFDPFGAVVASSPQDAGELAQRTIQSAAASRKAGVTQAYDTAKTLPGEIYAGAFEGIVPKIKHELSLGDNPIVVDNLTPRANKALDYIENQVANLKIKNRADPFGQPNPENIVGISLKGIEQWRKNLVAMRNDAFASGNGADGRAMRGVIKAFDEHVDSSINGGLFNGDPKAVQAWNDARAAHADYKSTFSAGTNDPVGRVVERIMGKGNNPAAIPNDVADFIYGSSGVNPSSLNVNVAKRVQGILGDKSPEWSGVKQGLFSRLVETPEGVTNIGSGKIAQRINQFLNGSGKELAETVFSPAERSVLRQYADLHRALEVPQTGANWSNTASTLAPILERISNKVGAVIGGVIGHVVAPGAGGAGEVVGTMVGGKVSSMGRNAQNARQIAAQMPLVNQAVQKWIRQLQFYQTNNNPRAAVALSLATSRMSQALEKIGVDIRSIQAPAQSAAESNQNPEPRPPGQ